MYKITLTSARTAKVTAPSGKVFDCKVEPYHREKDGKRSIQFQVRVDNVEGNKMSSGVIQVPKNKDGKFKKDFTSKLDGRRTTAITANFGELFS